MKKMTRVLVVALAVTIAICFTPCHGLLLDTPRYNSTAEFLGTHNKARAAVGVAPLKWNTTLADHAFDIAWSIITDEMGECQDSLDPKSLHATAYDFGSYNMHWDHNQSVTSGRVVERWVAMKKYYNYARNSCVRNVNCASYTQVVWRKSLELGCDQVRCLVSVGITNGVTICVYSPPGNIPGEKPY